MSNLLGLSVIWFLWKYFLPLWYLESLMSSRSHVKDPSEIIIKTFYQDLISFYGSTVLFFSWKYKFLDLWFPWYHIFLCCITSRTLKVLSLIIKSIAVSMVLNNLTNLLEGLVLVPNLYLCFFFFYLQWSSCSR